MTRTEKLADNKRRAASANAELRRREKLLYDYLNSAEVKQLRKDVHDAIDEINVLIHEWNDIVLEEHATSK